MSEFPILDYRSSIATFARTAQNLLETANIQTPEQAMASDDLLHGLSSAFPRLHNLAVELNCFWGAGIPLYGEEPAAPVDRAAAFFNLSGKINGFLDNSFQFQNVRALLQQPDLNIADDIHAGLELVDAQTNRYQKHKASDWLRSAFTLFKSKLPIYRDQQQENSEHKICAERLPELLAFSLSADEYRPNLDAIAEALCGTYQQLGNFRRMPSRGEIERHLLNNLKRQGCMKVVEKSLPPAPDVMERLSKLIYDNCNFNLYLSDTERLVELGQKQLSYAADYSQTRNLIFCQLREEGIPAIEPLRFIPGMKEKKYSFNTNNLAAVNSRIQAFRRNQGWIKSYENAVIAPDLVSDFKKLVKGWINITADTSDKSCIQLCNLINRDSFSDKESRDIGKGLIKQAETVIHACHALQQTTGLNFNDSGLGLEHLDTMKRQETLDIGQLHMLNRLFSSFSQFYEANPQQFELKAGDDIGEGYVRRLASLSPSLQRYNMLFYSAHALADISVAQTAEIKNLERLCAHDLQEVGKPLFGQLCADVDDYCAADFEHRALSRNIDFNVCRFYLLPQYEEKEISSAVSQELFGRNLPGWEACPPDERLIISSLAERHFQRLLPLHQEAINRTAYPSDRFMAHFDDYRDLKNQNLFYRENLQLIKQVLPVAKENNRLYHQLNVSELITPQPGLSRMLVASRSQRNN